MSGTYIPREVLPNDDGTGEEVVTTEAQFSRSLPTEVSVIGVRTDNIQPTTSVHNSKVLQWHIQSSLNYLINPKATKVIIEYKIVDQNGNNLPLTIPGQNNQNVDNPDARVLPVNGLGSALFKSCEIKVNDKTIAGGSNLYAFKADIQTRVSNNKEVKDNQLTLQGWYEEEIAWDDLTNAAKDVIFTTDDLSVEAPQLNGFIHRWLNTKGSKRDILVTDVFSDVFNEHVFLPPNASLDVILTRQDNDKFCLLTDRNEEYKIVIEKAYLEVEMKVMDADFIETKVENMKKGIPWRASFKHVEMMRYTYGQNLTDLSRYNLFNINSVSPNRFFVVLLRQNAFNGDYTLDPFNYTGFNMEHFKYDRTDNNTRHPIVYVNRWDKDYKQAVYNLYKAVGLNVGPEEALGITNYNFDRRNFIMGFNLEKNEGATAGVIYDLPDKVVHSLEIKLKTGLTNPVSMIIYAEFNAEMLIDAYGNVTLKENALA